jgi:hypothetical protein
MRRTLDERFSDHPSQHALQPVEEALALLLDFLLREQGEPSMRDLDDNHSNEEEACLKKRVYAQ